MISVLMPMRNAADFVEEAVRSVLGQDEDLELIVINDGSVDGSDEIIFKINDRRIHLLRGPEQGIAAALNCGLQAARGDVIVRCDADDLLPPGRLRWQADWLRNHPEHDAVCGYFSTFSRRGKLLADLKPSGPSIEITDELRHGITRTSLCAFAVRATLLHVAGTYRDYFVTAEDLDMQFRIGEAGRVWYEARPAYLYRLHDASITHTQANTARLHFEQAARDFQSQRLSTGADDLMRGKPPLLPESGDGALSAAEQSQGHLLARAWREHQEGTMPLAIYTGLRACLCRPADWRVWKSWLAMIAGAVVQRPRNAH